MKCTQCGRPGHPNRPNCMYCGGTIDHSFEDLHIDCPGCGTTMEKKTFDGITIDQCPACSGVWFDRNELEEALKKKKPINIDTAIPSSLKTQQQQYNLQRTCPRCGKTMASKQYQEVSRVIIDICRFHGCYLDAGEFERLYLFSKQFPL